MVLGNLLTLPVGGGLLYVQPVYVRAVANSASYPLLQKVLVAFGDQIGFDDTLQGALDQVFGGNSGTTATTNTTKPNTNTTAPAGSSLSSALKDAQKAFADSQAAYSKGDFKAYGEALGRLKDALARASMAS